MCSLPWRLRVPLAYDRALCADMLAAFVGALQRSLRQRAKRALGLQSVSEAEIGAVTFVLRCDSSLRLNVHAHTLALDGVYVREQSGALQFHRLPDPAHEQAETLWSAAEALTAKTETAYCSNAATGHPGGAAIAAQSRGSDTSRRWSMSEWVPSNSS